ncbi:hypothetical protein F7734_10320 [Scytonema sp. UIC 10036]|uniref:hypothetical protein n=1 Tax=Scytonema sp. UIC 10036 TaxID=2304196 RepID=UPI0012DA4C2B|nr:hypothetical protein [Scytonema sp. UIC 10036]MUG92822.1 hypothetical protein [Scytonema sp. UIC 10036]
MRSKLERWYPVTFGFFITALCYLLFRSKPLPSSLKDIFSAATTLSGIAVGFLATAMSILFTISNTFVVKQIKNTNKYTRLINYFMDAINWSFLLAAFSLVGLFIDINNLGVWQWSAFGIWLFTLITSGLSSYRVIRVFAAILRAAN